MIQKLTMQLGRTLRRLLCANVVLGTLCLAFGFLYGNPENKTVFLALGSGCVAFAGLIFLGFQWKNRAKYRKLCDTVGQHEIEKMEEEYLGGQRTKAAVFGHTHLFLEPGCNTLGFDLFQYSQIFWMYLYQHTTKLEFIPVMRSWSIRIYLDDPARGRQQMVEVNARRFRKNPQEFFGRVVAKNPNILLGYSPEWARMHDTNRQAFIQFVRSQQVVSR